MKKDKECCFCKSNYSGGMVSKFCPDCKIVYAKYMPMDKEADVNVCRIDHLDIIIYNDLLVEFGLHGTKSYNMLGQIYLTISWLKHGEDLRKESFERFLKLRRIGVINKKHGQYYLISFDKKPKD